MHIYLGTDHAGFELKEAVKKHLTEIGYEVTDCGATEYDETDDYPYFCIACAEATKADPGSLGIVFGGSGNGEQMAANKVEGIRAALCWNVEIAQLARQHNNAQVMSIGARQHSTGEALEIIDAFLTTPWSEESRHQRRIDKMGRYDAEGINEQ